MTKAKAMELMNEYSRQVIDPSLARKIAQAFGYTLSQLGLKGQKVSSFHRLNYSEETKNLTAISVSDLAQAIMVYPINRGWGNSFDSEEKAKEYANGVVALMPDLKWQIYHPIHTDKEVEQGICKLWEVYFSIRCMLNGAGSSAQFITEKSLEIISK